VFALGVDPGLSRCGYGAVARHGHRLCAHAAGVIRTSPDDPLADRLAALLADLRSVIDDLGPDIVVVERVLFQANARTAMSVGQASGLALVAAAEAGRPVVQYSPNEVKQAVAGYGGAPKQQVQRMVQSLLGLPVRPTPADTADALALAICHLTGTGLRAAVAAAVPTTPEGPAEPPPAPTVQRRAREGCS
jgi:crossover junction endodeoxyribonuclease RuvC